MQTKKKIVCFIELMGDGVFARVTSFFAFGAPFFHLVMLRGAHVITIRGKMLKMERKVARLTRTAMRKKGI